MSFGLQRRLNKTSRRILVIRPDRIGDVILSTPVFRTLKESFPGAFVGALVSPMTSPLLEHNPSIDVILTDTPADHTGGTSIWGKAREIRSYRFDTALLLMPTQRLAYILFLAGIRYRVGVGHILYEVLTLMHGVSRKNYNPLRHETDYMLDLARKIGAAKIWQTPELFVTDDEKKVARDFLIKKGFMTDLPIVGLHPGSGGSAPNWTIARYHRLADKISKAGNQVLVTGSGNEKQIAGFFEAHHIPGLQSSFGELSLRELTAVISQVDLFISSSTGPMHIAAALGVPTVSMFCPLTACSPKLWGPLGNSASVVSPAEAFCRTRCPGDPHVCTFGDGDEGITVNDVFNLVNTVKVS